MKVSKARHIVKVSLLCAFAGLVINVLVAWALALPDPDEWYQTHLAERAEAPSDRAFELAIGPLPPGLDESHPRATCRAESRVGVRVMFVHVTGTFSSMTLVRTGFPFESMQRRPPGVFRFDDESALLARLLLGLSLPLADTPGPVPRGLPLMPIWPGFIGNTLLYGGLLGVLAVTGRGLRRHRLRRLGRCAACAYPWHGDDEARCTECGALADGSDQRVRVRLPLRFALFPPWGMLWRLGLWSMVGASLAVSTAWARANWVPPALPVEVWWNEGNPGVGSDVDQSPFSGDGWTPVPVREEGWIRPERRSGAESAEDMEVLRPGFHRVYEVDVSSNPSATIMYRAEDRIGWPAKALGNTRSTGAGLLALLRSPDTVPSPDKSGVAFTLPPAPHPLLGSTFERDLPGRILWPGFVVNTAFYAVLAWLAFLGLRCWLRAHRCREKARA